VCLGRGGWKPRAGKSVEIKGSKSDKAELSRTYGEGQYQVSAREPVGDNGVSQQAGEEMYHGRERGRIEELALTRATREQPCEQRM
jgi:hypothetical protein